MANSTLANQIILSKNYTPGRNGNKVERITIHCVVGQLSCKAVTNLAHWQPGGQASANYIIGTDGKICLNVNEDNRAWTSGGKAGTEKVPGKTGKLNDFKAITIEVASDLKEPYAFNDTCYKRLIELCIDIMRRYNKNKAVFFPDAAKAENYAANNQKQNEMLFTCHRFYAGVSCPGDWFFTRLPGFVDELNSKLAGDTTTLYRVQVGAFKNKANAILLKQELADKGYDCFIVEGK